MSQEQKPTEAQTSNAVQRNALLRYIVIMFAVALILVLLSMVLQTQSSNQTISDLHQSSTSALTRAEALQNKNRELEESLAAEVAKSDNLQTQLDSSKKDMAVVKTESQNVRKAYNALAIVLMGEEHAASPEAYQAAKDTVNSLKSYLSPDIAALYDAYLGEKEQ